ncbi:hypothetical protein ES707_09460 [subsurface metagenome]
MSVENPKDGRKYYTKHSKRLIKALTEELYDDLYQVLREYICNSVDGKGTKVDITCRPPYKIMTIDDNGEGIDHKTWDYMLDNFAISVKKDDPNTIGMHGLGIYSGALICESITVKTKIAEDSTVRVVKLPVSDWLKDEGDELLESEYVETIQEGLYYYLDTEDVTDKTPTSFTMVILSNLKDSIKKTFQDKKKSYKNFLEKSSKSWPIDFPPNFKKKNLDLYTQISKFYTENKLLGPRNQFKIQVYLNGAQIFKWIPRSKNADLRFYDIETVNIKLGSKTVASLWWTMNRDESFLDNYEYLKLWLDYLEKGKPEIEKYKDLDIVEDFSIDFNGEKLNLNYSSIKDTIKRAESAKKIGGIFLRLKNVLIYKPSDIWSNILKSKRSRQWEQCWGEIFVLDQDIYPEMSRTKLRGKKMEEFNEKLSEAIVGDEVLGKISIYHHHGKSKNYYLPLLTEIERKIKSMFVIEDLTASESIEATPSPTTTPSPTIKQPLTSATKVTPETVEHLESLIDDEEEDEIDIESIIMMLTPNEYDDDKMSELKRRVRLLILDLGSIPESEINDLLMSLEKYSDSE